MTKNRNKQRTGPPEAGQGKAQMHVSAQNTKIPFPATNTVEDERNETPNLREEDVNGHRDGNDTPFPVKFTSLFSDNRKPSEDCKCSFVAFE